MSKLSVYGILIGAIFAISYTVVCILGRNTSAIDIVFKGAIAVGFALMLLGLTKKK